MPIQIDSRDRVTALSHLYRGELGRVATYRVRLDSTTNWAVGTSAAMISFALGNALLPHWVIGLTLLLDAMFLRLEAQRYQLYRSLLSRVRILEQGFFPQVLRGESRRDWEQELLSSLEAPETPITLMQAVSIRLRRVYLWLMVATYVAWFIKLGQLGHVPESARVDSIPGPLVIGIGLVPLLLAIGLVFHHRDVGVD